MVKVELQLLHCPAVLTYTADHAYTDSGALIMEIGDRVKGYPLHALSYFEAKQLEENTDGEEEHF